VFEGKQSRRHRDVRLGQLYLQGWLHRPRCARALRGADTFVQFVGFPRSGHSLLGSILDAHRQALVAHELDAMGLFEKGLSAPLVFSLIHANSVAFSRHGRYWNGFSYQMPGQHNGACEHLRVIGDKKGDWAVRWFAADPALLERVWRQVKLACKWILVVRHPLDNIATMSLRRGGHYDRLRIATPDGAAFREALAQRQGTDIAAQALDSMIDDYRSLCDATEAMKARIDPGDWHEIHYERFSQNPVAGINELLAFLDLPADPDFLNACAATVHRSTHQSRRQVAWTDHKLARVEEMIDGFSFLQRYRDQS